MNSEELTIIFNCVGWPDLGGGSAVSQFAMMARKFGKQLIVAVSEKDAIKLKANFDIIGMLSYGKENFIAMSHTKSELTGGNVGTGLKIDVNKKHTYWLE